MRVTVKPIVIGALGTVLKRLESVLEVLEIVERIKIIQMTASVRSTRILRKVLETLGNNCSSLKTSLNPAANAVAKNLEEI